MGSKSDWETMRHADEMLTKFGVTHECRVLSAHRTPKEATAYIASAEARGIQVVIAAAGGAAHLAGVAAAHTLLPVFGVPMESASLKGLDSLLSTVQMPGGIPVGTLAILALNDRELRAKLQAYREEQARAILSETVG
jgi:5-(carboxyamino)imidazole ribonucleotide mutase